MTETTQPGQTPTPAPTAQPTDSPWVTILSEEFDQPALDTSLWEPCYENAAPDGCTNASNPNVNWYVPDDVIPDPQAGVLVLRAQRRTVTTSEGNFEYTSGMISSHRGFAFTYGYVEARVRSPKGQGLWPALWLLPAEAGWPPEIDVMEILGHEPDTAHMTLHFTDQQGLHAELGRSFQGPDFSQDFHTFGLLWEPDRLVWFIDGVERYRVTQAVPSESMYIIANLAVGGDWPGIPDATTPFPSTFEIDYIRVTQLRSPSPDG